MMIAVIVGTAGSGKTYLTGALSEYIADQGGDVLQFNLDPGVYEATLPYE
ncbi:MAG: GTPase, partial [Candidatus Korarchaeota archaeon]|nr:GTPase [Candidatus Korarchaeota archaeon]NIU83561.1 GTPase [Candidatus Thorarchaeota archaeon]NIW14330.1 GTPase [Candidatus Thorarchaeota archaeon]